MLIGTYHLHGAAVPRCVSDNVSQETDNDSAMSSPTELQAVAVIPAGSLAGSKFKALLPSTHDYKRYLSVKYTVANGNLTTGKVSTYLTDTDTLYKAHSDAKPAL